ncbi:MAG: phospholipase D family protein [Bacteroidales bacterium]|nr:phospholipase D family protein [Bacteroidales bacterium]
MELILDDKILRKRFSNLCKKYSRYIWAVAWAGKVANFDLAKILAENSHKIDKILVGLHFYQTDPSFIDCFKDNHHVRFYKKSDGIFHSKVYLFYNSDSEWSAIVGSSNFTNSGFHRNEEANICIDDTDVGISFSQLKEYITSLWNEGSMFSNSELDLYKSAFVHQQKKLDSLKKSKAVSNDTSHAESAENFTASQLSIMTWEEYFHNITVKDSESLIYRLAILKEAQKLFKKNQRFASLEPDKRKAIAGIISHVAETDNADWKFFGSTGNGKFMHAINAKDPVIMNAIDSIPLNGDVTKDMFENYCKAFSSWNDPMSSATRLIAMKRPDLFVCVNSKNKKELSQLLGIPQSHLTLENYWNEVHLKIINSVWFRDNNISNVGIAKEVKKFQVALLDSISYTH